MAFERKYRAQLTARLLEKRSFIQVLAGPRQVGKTTVVNQVLVDFPSHYVAADGVANADAAWLIQQWETARILQQQDGGNDFVLAIDEIQKIRNWSETVKKLWDEDTRMNRPLKVILLGSSRLLLQQGLTESLAGRFELIHIGHWSLSEMKDAFNWTPQQFVWFGGYPGSARLIAEEERWKKYILDTLIETSISKDILMLTRVDKPELLRRLFEIGCSYSGQVLSYNKILGQLQDGGNTTTLAGYLTLLGQAGLLSGLEKFSGNVIVQRGSSPKFQVHNTALMSALHPGSFVSIQQRPDVWGRHVESAVGAHLINHAQTEGFRLFYWREGRYEVDFVLEKKGLVIGLEVKSGVPAKFYPGTMALKNSFRIHKTLLIGDGGIPWQQFLEMNPSSLF